MKVRIVERITSYGEKRFVIQQRRQLNPRVDSSQWTDCGGLYWKLNVAWRDLSFFDGTNVEDKVVVQ